MAILAKKIDRELEEIWGQPMGFALLTFQFNTQGKCHYISNGSREDMVNALIEASVRLGLGRPLEEQAKNEGG
jgi:hypothetical protein